MPRVSFYTLGCKLNHSETAALQSEFEERDFQIVPFEEKADVAVINTCTVTSTAESKARNKIRRAARRNPDGFVIVTGCYAQLRPDELAEIDGVDFVLGSQEKFQLFELINDFSKPDKTQVRVSCIDDNASFGPSSSHENRTRAFLKVQDGCDYSCAFCTIPDARGPSRSQSISKTVVQARDLARQGYKEIVLTGVNIGLFGQKNDESLIDLIRELDGVEGIDRYRISSIEPNLLTEEIIDFVAESRAFQPHFHIPLQSGDNYVLGKMRRRYQREDYANRVRYIRKVLPDAAIGVDVIVGFPAETKSHFENTYRFVNQLDVSYLHAFTYSERPGTAAVDDFEKMGGEKVPVPERKRRNKMIRALSQKKQQAFARKHKDSVRDVLWEAPQSNGNMYGYTGNYIRVRRPADPERENMIEAVRLGALNDDGTVSAENADYVPLDVAAV